MLFERRVLRRTFGPKRDDIIAGRRKPHNEELHNLYSLSHIIRMVNSRRIRWGRRVVCMTEVWQENPDGKGSQGRPKCSWANIIKMDLREIE